MIRVRRGDANTPAASHTWPTGTYAVVERVSPMMRSVAQVADLLHPAALLPPAANTIMQLALPSVRCGLAAQ